MFTGIIEYIGKVRSARLSTGSGVISVEIGPLTEDTKLGDSIAVNGVCLTVTRLTGTTADFDVSGETVTRSNIGKRTPGSSVNLERAMSAGGRFGGHIVQGHIDGTAKLSAIKKQGDFTELTFALDQHLLDEVVPKGSIAIDGISLTIAALKANTITIAVIPATWNETTLGNLKTGDMVNIETDIICKTIKRQLQTLTSEGKLTMDKLRQAGF